MANLILKHIREHFPDAKELCDAFESMDDHHGAIIFQELFAEYEENGLEKMYALFDTRIREWLFSLVKQTEQEKVDNWLSDYLPTMHEMLKEIFDE